MAIADIRDVKPAGDEPATVYQKLLAVQRASDSVLKDKKSHQGWGYVSSSSALGAIRDAMNDIGLLLIMEIVGHEMALGVAYKDGQHLTRVDLMCHWVNADDPADRISIPWVGWGIDNGEKGLGKALTYAEKYFILKQLHLPTDDDDPEAHLPGAKTNGKQATPPARPQANPTQAKREAVATTVAKGKPAPEPLDDEEPDTRPTVPAHVLDALKAAVQAAGVSSDEYKKLRKFHEQPPGALTVDVVPSLLNLIVGQSVEQAMIALRVVRAAGVEINERALSSELVQPPAGGDEQ